MPSGSNHQTPEALVNTWANAYLAAAREGRDSVFVEVDGERANDATVRWIEMVAADHGLEAASLFASKANELLFAATALGRAERAARGRWGWQARSAVKDARAQFDAAAAAVNDWHAIPEALGHLRKVNPALYDEVERGAARRFHDHDRSSDHRSVSEPSPLHAHEITPDDAALIRMLTGAQFADTATVVLPSGKTVTGAEMRRWVQGHER